VHSRRYNLVNQLFNFLLLRDKETLQNTYLYLTYTTVSHICLTQHVEMPDQPIANDRSPAPG